MLYWCIRDILVWLSGNWGYEQHWGKKHKCLSVCLCVTGWEQLNELEWNTTYIWRTYSYSKTKKMRLFLKLFILVKHSTYFERSFRPSSGAQDCTYNNRHMPDTATCCKRGRDGKSSISPKHVECINPLNPELNPICYLLAILGAHHFLHVSRIRVKLLTFRLLMSYIYGATILDVSRSHTTTQHSR